MTMKVRIGVASLALVAVLGFVYQSGASNAAGEKDVPEAVKKIADAIKDGNKEKASAVAASIAKNTEELSDLMHSFRPRAKGGLGWGSKEGANKIEDGLEKKIQIFAKAVPAAGVKDVENNQEAARWIAALAEITIAKAPTKDASGGKTKKAWIEITEQMREGAHELSKASAAKNAGAMQKAASKVNSACINCHSKFKE